MTKKDIDTDERKVEIFKYMIQFLEIYGNENFGESAEIDWSKVWEYCSKCDMMDFNIEVEDLVYHTSDDEFRDKVFEFVEHQVLDGYPLWRLFKMSDWLSQKCEEELINIEHQKDIEYFNKTKCYRCKYFQCKLQIMYATAIEPCCVGDYDSIEQLRERKPNAVPRSITHKMTCNKRQELLSEAFHKKYGDNKHVSSFEKEDFDYNYNFKYKKFNYRDESQNNYSKYWEIYPMKLKRCPYFEESDMTLEKFEKLWDRIPRYE